MRRTMTRIGLALAAVIMLTAGGPNSTILVDDFNDGNDDGWEHEDVTPAQMATFDASSGYYTLDSFVPVPIDDPSVGTVDAHWEPSIANPRFSNGTLRGTFQANTEGSTVGFLLRANEETFSDYGFYGSSGFGTFYIERFDTSAPPTPDQQFPGQTIIAMAKPAEHPFVVGQAYHIAASVVGQNIQMKAWKVGDPEPVTPMLSVRDRGLKPNSGSAICTVVIFDPVPLSRAGVSAVRTSGTFDDITFTPGVNR
jgi:hypothetical protein